MNRKGRIFILDDDELILSVLSRVLKKEGYEVNKDTRTDGVINRIKSWSADLVFLDIRMQGRNGIDILQEIKDKGIDTQVVLLTSDDTAETAVKAMKLGADDYLTKPFNTDEIKIVVENILRSRKLRHEVDYLRKAYTEFFRKDIVSDSPVMKELITKVEKIAQAGVSTVLITGESGTGKELLARNIHTLMYGECSTGCSPFISVNCAAMPETLLESELFGYEKGAFTDARSDKKGLFELSKGGSILLDEIGDMKIDLQSKFLRVLEERTVRHIGGKDEIPIDSTVIATTNKNLSEEIEKGGFRKDLFFRLSTFYLHILPLRERTEDIPKLIRHFLSLYATKYKNKKIKGLSPDAEQLLLTYEWPGNVRELKNLVESFVVLENVDIIQPKHLPKWLVSPSTAFSNTNDRFILPDDGISLEEVEKDLIVQALERANDNKTQAAKLLNISYETLRYQIKKFDLT